MNPYAASQWAPDDERLEGFCIHINNPDKVWYVPGPMSNGQREFMKNNRRTMYQQIKNRREEERRQDQAVRDARMRENIAALRAAVEAANCDRRIGTTIAIPIDKENMSKIPEYKLFPFIDNDETCKKPIDCRYKLVT